MGGAAGADQMRQNDEHPGSATFHAAVLQGSKAIARRASRSKKTNFTRAIGEMKVT
jgi:hypothetical protein